MFAYPLGTGIVQSFSDPEWGLQNYVWFFSSEANRDMLWRTLAVAGSTTALTLIIGYPYAYLMTLVGPTLRTVLLALVMLPFWVSALVRTFSWFVILQDAGALNQLLTAMGFEPVHLIRTPVGVMIGMTQVLLPFMVFPLFNVLNGINRRLLTAAESMGARPVSAFFRVFVPLSGCPRDRQRSCDRLCHRARLLHLPGAARLAERGDAVCRRSSTRPRRA